MSTLRAWAARITLKPGLLNNVITLMKSSDYKPKDKLCVISFDEMKIKSSFEYDKRNDATLKPTKFVQVAMVRGLCKNWKQPVFYDFDTPMTFSILNHIIKNLYLAQFIVVAIVSDLGPTNQVLRNQLEQKTYLSHPCDETKKIFVFADVPHIIKLIRNHFLDDGFIINNKLITTEPIKELLKQENSDLRISFKISTEHLDVSKTARQKVKLATKLFSHTISCCIKRLISLGKCSSENAMECAEFIKLVNDWFDIFNSKVPSSPNMKAFGLEITEQKQIISKMDDVISNLRTTKKSTLLPFQKAIITNNKALQDLYNYLNINYNISFILTGRLNQDILENFFGIIRAKGGFHDHPTAIEFNYRLRSYILGNLSEHI